MKSIVTDYNKRYGSNCEVVEAVKRAKELVEEKDGFKCGNEIRRRLELHIDVGHNIYTTTIYLVDKEGLAPAYYCNGTFWLTRCGCEVQLIA